MDLADSIITFVNEKLLTFKSTLNTAIVGKIVSFDAATVTAEIQLGVSYKMADGTFEQVTNLLEVPIMVLQAGGFSMTFPVKAGDECLVIFQQRDISTWIESGGPIQSVSNRQLDMSDAVAIVGIQSRVNRVQAYDPANFQIRTENVSLTITPDGMLTVDTRDSVSITADSGVEITGDVSITGDALINGALNTTGKIITAATVDDGNGCLSTHIHQVSDAGDVTFPPDASAPCA